MFQLTSPAEQGATRTLPAGTEYPGYAMNADFEGEHADKNDRPDLLCDPERQDNGWICCDMHDGGSHLCCDQEEGEKKPLMFETKNNAGEWEPINSSKVVISSYDFASYGRLKAELFSVQYGPGAADDKPRDSFNNCRIRGRPKNESRTTIPIDRIGGVNNKGNKIADCGWTAENAQILDNPPVAKTLVG